MVTSLFFSAQSKAETVGTGQITFTGTQMGAPVQGNFRKFSADLHFDARDLPHSYAHITIDLTSIDLTSEESEDEIKGKHWFNIQSFPQAHFDSSEIQIVGLNQYLVSGLFQLKGISKPLRIPLKMSYDHGGRSAQGRFILKRNDFGVGDGTWSATDTVADEVTVDYRFTLIP
ncbi:YceI family protein [Ferrovum myxofaciens]|jgi:polyisoprenoid-binding protein YceI|nr:YceI family protein [Ferrovum myxofaciens]MBU6993660.1 YceI family protein [Ferrovum myxofaciens]QKE37636.2 MAG: YceI family protein [Ferrovum myxofaciens]QKE40148.1 MAG: YceI family protein [Ferrovum myxofaciens]QWY75294.1 MAG: YceI family protein [Ferrovum myxofaciens]QWY78034.1 MAG: YceI family protein [Ferrovum myxofaciens]